jgi:hypothetical protein
MIPYRAIQYGMVFPDSVPYMTTIQLAQFIKKSDADARFVISTLYAEVRFKKAESTDITRINVDNLPTGVNVIDVVYARRARNQYRTQTKRNYNPFLINTEDDKIWISRFTLRNWVLKCNRETL